MTLPPPPRQTSNLLEHKIMNDLQHHHPVSSHGEQHAYYPHSLPQLHLSSINRAKMAFNSQIPEPYKPIVPLSSAAAATKDMPIRERSSHSDRSSSSSPVKSSSSSREQQQQQQPVTQFCLCQPDPKIPRPRNGKTKFCDHEQKSKKLIMTAFILYRQHYQAAVVAQNPGLANPEISKIIGEQWRKLPQETKDEWKALAEVRLYNLEANLRDTNHESGGESSSSTTISRISLSAPSLRP